MTTATITIIATTIMATCNKYSTSAPIIKPPIIAIATFVNVLLLNCTPLRTIQISTAHGIQMIGYSQAEIVP